jgi:hypothetical protein
MTGTDGAAMLDLVGLTPEELMFAARVEAGLDDFGDHSFVEGLTVYLESVTAEADLNPIGHRVIQGGVVRVLANRLRYVDDLQRHPEIAEEKITSPVVILGVPRTGTTKLQRMMCSDPGFQSLDLWRVLNPAPAPRNSSSQADPRIAIAVEYEQMLRQMAPAFMAAHPTLAMEPDEDAYLLDMTFECLFPQLRTHVPAYGAWLSDHRGIRPYEFLRSMLQYLQWQDGGAAHRPWVLKTPLHLGNIPSILHVFPDAVLVHCHRDLSAVLPSICRMVQSARQIVSNQVDPIALGSEMLGMWSAEMACYLNDRAALAPEILDVDYRTILADTHGVIQQIYLRLGRELTHETRENFARWDERNPQHRHGRNEYSLDTYGLTAEAIHKAFDGYDAIKR